jgi:RHS repeat-associated protein
VLATVSDKKIGVDANSDGVVNYYTADVVTANDYAPFGAILSGRNYNAPSAKDYKYGFNGKMNDNEVKGIEGSQQDYGRRIYDPRLGRFLSVDPLTRGYPGWSPYPFAMNRPIDGLDLDGLEYVNFNDVTDERVAQLGLTFKDEAAKKKFLDEHKVIHNGVEYFNAGQHIYADPSGAWSYVQTEGSAKVTQWVYTDIQLYDATVNHAFGWEDDKLPGKAACCPKKNANVNCADLAKAQANELGTNLEGGDVNTNSIIKAYNAGTGMSLKFEEAVDYINSQLEKGFSVVVGVDDDGVGKKDGLGTDHYVTITGRSFDKKSGGYFLFMENAIGFDKPDQIADFGNAASFGNALFPSAGKVKGNSPNWNNTSFTVTRVQKNTSEKKEESKKD